MNRLVSIIILLFLLVSTLRAENAEELSVEQSSPIGPGPTSTIEGTDLSELIWVPEPSLEVPVPLAPGLGTIVEGINFDEDGANNGSSYHIPPDPIGAAGPDHLVSVVNKSSGILKPGFRRTARALKVFSVFYRQ